MKSTATMMRFNDNGAAGSTGADVGRTITGTGEDRLIRLATAPLRQKLDVPKLRLTTIALAALSCA